MGCLLTLEESCVSLETFLVCPSRGSTEQGWKSRLLNVWTDAGCEAEQFTYTLLLLSPYLLLGIVFILSLLERRLRDQPFTWTMVGPCRTAPLHLLLPGLSQQTTSPRNKFAPASGSGPTREFQVCICHASGRMLIVRGSLIQHLLLNPNQGTTNIHLVFCCNTLSFLCLPLRLD